MYRWEANVESMDVQGDWIVMHPENMTITKLQDVAAYIWSRLRDPATTAELVNDVLSVFAVTRDVAEPEVAEFLHELIRIGIIEVVGKPSAV